MNIDEFDEVTYLKNLLAIIEKNAKELEAELEDMYFDIEEISKIIKEVEEERIDDTN